MKGKRKDKAIKWRFKNSHEVDAQCLLSKRSLKSAHRFLDAALAHGPDFEPLGVLAGKH